MTEISLLNPLVLNGLVQKFTVPEELILLSSVPQTASPLPTASWEIIRGSRAIAKPTVPNSEATIVDRLGREAKTASFYYLREKKVFLPTTLHWLRQAANNVSDLSRTNAEAAVTRELQDLNTRFDNFNEFALWQAIQGELRYVDERGAEVVVDYGFLPTHKPKASADWSAPGTTFAQIVNDIRALKRVIQRNGQVTADTAYASEKVINYIFDKAADNGNAGAQLSDRQKDEYFSTGRMSGFLGLNWQVQESVYDATASGYTATPTSPEDETPFLNPNAIVIGNFKTNRPVEFINGPSADDEAPSGYTGKFVKTWKEKDPSARQVLLEQTALPVVTRPEQIATIKDVTA